MSERQFSEDEVADILKRAVELQDSGAVLPATRSGLTLTELKEIGKEVGVAPEVIERAARKVERGTAPSRSLFGLPLGVGRTVELNRTLTDEEWERLVVGLRETFDARGVVRSEGSLRSWSNGNLQVLLEPGANGQRLRMQTVNGAAQGWTMASFALFAMLLAMAIFAALRGALFSDAFLAPATMIGAMGAGAFALGTLRLPGWARTRQRQMDEIADRVEPNP